MCGWLGCVSLFGNPEQNMCIVTISFAQGRKLLSESHGHPLLPEMKGHGLNYLEANSSKGVRLGSVSPCGPHGHFGRRENAAGLVLGRRIGRLVPDTQDQVHPKMKEHWTDESFTPCLQHFCLNLEAPVFFVKAGFASLHLLCHSFNILFFAFFFLIHLCFPWP